MKYHYHVKDQTRSTCGFADASDPADFVYDETGFLAHNDNDARCKLCAEILHITRSSGVCATVSPSMADAFGMRNLPNTVVLEECAI